MFHLQFHGTAFVPFTSILFVNFLWTFCELGFLHSEVPFETQLLRCRTSSTESVRFLFTEDGLQGPMISDEGNVHPKVVTTWNTKKEDMLTKHLEKTFVEGWWWEESEKPRKRKRAKLRCISWGSKTSKLHLRFKIICGAPRLPQTPTTVISQQTVTHKPSIQTNQTSIKKRGQDNWNDL